MSKLLSTLDVRLIDEAKNLWQLLAPLVYQSDVLGVTMELPVGFQTNFASIPRIPIVFEKFGGKFPWEAALHDGGYQYQPFPREQIDLMLHEACILGGMSHEDAWAVYKGVRLFGGSPDHWQTVPAQGNIIVPSTVPIMVETQVTVSITPAVSVPLTQG